MSDDSQVVSTAGASDAGQNTATDQGPSQPVSLTDDSLVTWEGVKEPVKFSAIRGLQSQFTKVSQERAKLAQELAAREQRTQQLEGALRQLMGQRSQAQPQDPLASLREAPYLSGQDAAGQLERLYKELEVRDQILKLVAQRFGQMENVVQGLHQSYAQSSFENKIASFVKQAGFDPEFVEDAKVLYLAYEPGPELDAAFPDMLKRHLDAQQQRLRKFEQARLQKSRENAFNIPGKGGNSAALKSLDFAGKTPQEQADLLWDALQAGSDT